jgi:hypothetical protein
LSAPILPTGESIDTATDRTRRPLPIEIKSTFSFSNLQQLPLYLYNQKSTKVSVRRDSEAEILSTQLEVLAPIAAEFDSLFDEPNTQASNSAIPESFIYKIHGSPEYIEEVNKLNRNMRSSVHHH